WLGVMLAAVAWTGIAVTPNTLAVRWPALAVMKNVTRGVAHGQLNGRFAGTPNGLTAAALEPGDILFCHNPGGCYGYWTHVVLYVGDGWFMDANDFAHGTQLRPLAVYRNYETVAQYRVRAAPAVRRCVADAGRQTTGLAYDPLSPLTDPHSQYCSKVIWQLYDRQGVRLCPPSTWVLPDDLASSRMLTRLQIWRAPERG
ncbi:MAG: C40 family peptidase, partial [Alicyclobacillus sp.]|nr:C40 family peptidase [Alicyclobacillus sp.]